MHSPCLIDLKNTHNVNSNVVCLAQLHTAPVNYHHLPHSEPEDPEDLGPQCSSTLCEVGNGSLVCIVTDRSCLDAVVNLGKLCSRGVEATPSMLHLHTFSGACNSQLDKHNLPMTRFLLHKNVCIDIPSLHSDRSKLFATI